MGIFEENAPLFLAVVVLVSAACGYAGAELHRVLPGALRRLGRGFWWLIGG